MSSIIFRDTMVPIIEKDYASFWGIVFYIGNVILLRLTTKRKTTHMSRPPGDPHNNE